MSNTSTKRKHSEVSESKQSNEWIFKSLQDAPATELQSQLIAQGLPSQFANNISDKTILVKLLENFIRRAQLELEKNPHAKNIWKLASSSPPHSFFSEVVMFSYQDSIFFCGPFFPSSRDKPVTVMSKVNPDLTWTNVETSGKAVDPFKAFKRMPLFSVFEEKLYMAYPDPDTSKYCIDVLDLKTYVWSDFEVEQSTVPNESPLPRDYVDGCIHNGKLIVVGPPIVTNTEHNETVIHSLDLKTKKWSLCQFQGTANNFPNGSSIYDQAKEKLYSFSKDGGTFYILDLKTFTWINKPVTSKLSEFNCRRHSHLIQVHKDKLILMRNCDNFQINAFDIEECKWSQIESIGKRPTKVRTEASFSLLNDTIFTLCGQTGKNILICLNLEDKSFSKRTHDGILNRMFKEESLKDIKVIAKGKEVKAHKSVLAAKSDYFKEKICKISSNINEKVESIEFDFEGSILEMIVKHMYDSLEKQTFQHEELHQLFQVCCLIKYWPFLEELVDHVVESLTPETSLATFELSNLESPFKDHLFKHTVAYISKNKQKVSSQSKFIEFCQRNPNLVREIFGNLDNPQPPQKRIKSSEGSNISFTPDLYLEAPKIFN